MTKLSSSDRECILPAKPEGFTVWHFIKKFVALISSNYSYLEGKKGFNASRRKREREERQRKVKGGSRDGGREQGRRRGAKSTLTTERFPQDGLY